MDILIPRTLIWRKLEVLLGRIDPYNFQT